MTRVEVTPFEIGDREDIDAAARLLAARHRAHRLAAPGLDPRYEDPAATRAEIEALAARNGASFRKPSISFRRCAFFTEAARALSSFTISSLFRGDDSRKLAMSTCESSTFSSVFILICIEPW